MALSFTTTAAGGSADYRKYLHDSPVKTDRVNDPDLFDFTLAPVDASFVRLKPGNYIIFDTVTYPKWFTGYITNDPELEYLGVDKNRTPKWGYRYQAASDDVLLNRQPLGFFPPFLNMTQGVILKLLIARLAPGVFNVSGIQDGPKIARFVVDPKKKFSDVVKEFADAANFRWRANDFNLIYQQQDTTAATLIIDGNVKYFTPARLNIRPSLEPIINDVVVLGDVEPQDYTNEYFVGDGFTANFPLMASPYGVDSSILLDEVFSGNQIDNSKWDVFDTVSNWLRVDTGFLNVIGGSNNSSYDVYLQSSNVIPLEGSLRLTHGEFDFVDTASAGVNGVIAGLWTQAPNSSFTGCVYGVRVNKVSSTTTLHPIVDGVVDTGQSKTIDFTKRYIIRSLFTTQKIFRLKPRYSYLSKTGVVTIYGDNTVDTIAIIQTVITEVNPSDGSVVSTTTWSTPSATIVAANIFANYVPAASNDLHVTLTNITISIPMQASLETKPSGGSFAKKIIGPNEIDSFDGQSPVATITTSPTGLTQRSSLLGTPRFNPSNAALHFFRDSVNQTSTTPQVGELIHLTYRKAGVAVGRVQDGVSIATEALLWGDNGQRSLSRSDLEPRPRTSEECELAAAALVSDSAYQHYEGDYTQWHSYEFSGQPLSGTVLKFQNLPSAFFPSIQAELIHQVQTTLKSASPSERFEHSLTFGRPDRVRKLLASFSRQFGSITPENSAEIPNFIDVNAVQSTFADDVLAPILSSWNSTHLTFDTEQDVPFIPNYLLRTEEIDNGVWITGVTGTGTAPVVTPNNVVSPSGLTDGESVAFPATNASSTSGIGQPVVLSPVISGATRNITISVFLKAASAISILLELRRGTTLSGTTIASLNASVTTAWQRFTVTGNVASAGSGNSVVLDLLQNVSQAAKTVQVWGAQLQEGSAATTYLSNSASRAIGGEFEARYTDDQWGADTGKNLVSRFTTQTFTVPRTVRGKVVFVRLHDNRNKLLNSEDCTQSTWVKAGTTTTAQISGLNPDGNTSQISKVGFAAVANPFIYANVPVNCTFTKAVFTVWVKPDSGRSVRVSLSADGGTGVSSTPVDITGNGKWHKVTVFTDGIASTGTGNFRGGVTSLDTSFAFDCLVTRASLETDRTTPTEYFKTNATAYGALSRYAAGLRASLPLIPPAPTGSATYSDPANPVITVTLPAALSDVWGVEIRASNNSTVLYKKDLAEAGYLPTFTHAGNSSRSLSYFLYTYNLLGEYSSSYNATATIPTPALTIAVDDDAMTVNATITAGSVISVEFEVYRDLGLTDLAATGVADTNVFPLTVEDLVQTRYIRARAKDTIGFGSWTSTLSHTYSVSAVDAFDNVSYIESVGFPPTPTTDPTYGAPFGDYAQDMINEAWASFNRNYRRLL